LEVEQAVGLGQVADGTDEGLKGLGIEEGDFKGVAGVEGALVEVGVGEGELEGFGSLRDDEGLAEVGEEGIVFAEGDGGVGDLDAATGVPLGEQLVELAVGDAEHGGGFLAGADAGGDRAARADAVADVSEHLEFELARELSHAGGEVGAHQFGGIGEVTAIAGEGGAVAVALEGGGAVDVGDAAVVGGVAADQTREVAEFVENGGEEVVVAIGGGAKGGAEEGFRVHTSEFRVLPRAAVDEPAEAVGVGVEGEGAGGGAAEGVEAGDVGFGELASGEIGDLDIEVKWSCPCEEFCPGGKSALWIRCKTSIRGYQMSKYIPLSIDEMIKRYIEGERSFAGSDIYADSLSGVNLSGTNLCGSRLRGDWSGVNLSQSWLRGADLDADFREANLRESNLIGAILTQTDCTGINLSNAILCGASLGQTLLCGANLSYADLSFTLLEETGLDNANLSGANLQNAVGINVEILQRLGCTLCQTQMPDGSICNAGC
jgi:Pentapeptide repeats (8 copies)